MNTPRVLLSLLFLITAAISQANAEGPKFAGNTLVVHDVTFTYSGSTLSGDSDQYITDHYVREESSDYLDVYGLLEGGTVAEVGGWTTESGDIIGYLDGGQYGDSDVDLGESGNGLASLTLNDKPFSWVSGKAWLEVNFSENTIVQTLINDIYERSDAPETATYETVTYETANWRVSGEENGYYVDGEWRLNYSYELEEAPSGMESFNIFGYIFGWISSIGSVTYDEYGAPTWAGGHYYANDDSGSFMLGADGVIVGNDPVIGSFTGSFDGVDINVLSSRTGPSFAPAQLWVNGILCNWRSGVLDGTGTAEDYYSSDDDNVGFYITCNVANFTSGVESAAVYFQSAEDGYYRSGVFTTPGYDIQTSAPNRNSPIFSSSVSLWVNGTQYSFAGGVTDSQNNACDTWVNAGVGTLKIFGNSSTSSNRTIQLSYLGQNYGGAFSGFPSTISSSPNNPSGHVYVDATSPVGVPGFWINGVYYEFNGDDSYASSSGEHLYFGATESGNEDFPLEGYDANWGLAFTGSYHYGRGGIFTVTSSQTGYELPACPTGSDGTLRLSTGGIAGFPPAVSLGEGLGIWRYLGTAPDGQGTGTNAAYYGQVTGGPGTCLLKINSDTFAVTLTDYVEETERTGNYDTETCLFQTNTDTPLPMPMYGVLPCHNCTMYGLKNPPSGRPRTILVGGDVWRYIGVVTDGDNSYDAYNGYYGGQQLRLGQAGRDGLSGVTLIDPVNGDRTGTFYNNRFVMSTAGPEIYSGDEKGERTTLKPGASVLHTIAAQGGTIASDLDITGNVLSMGSLENDANTAGLTISFTDDLHRNVSGDPVGDATATVMFASARSLSNWLWARAESPTSLNTVTMMLLDSNHNLKLFSRENPTLPAVWIDPTPETGSASFKVPVRVIPAGDLSMGDFHHGTRPDGTVDN